MCFIITNAVEVCGVESTFLVLPGVLSLRVSRSPAGYQGVVVNVRISHAYRRGIALVSAIALAIAGVGAASVISSGPAGADPIGDCNSTTGAIVAVDFSHWGGTVQRGCDAHPSTGLNLLHNAGFSTTGTVHDGPGFICRIGTAAFNSGTQYPTTATEACTLTPPATAYWSYWIAPAGQSSWTYSPLGVLGDVPQAGEVEAWVFGGTDIDGSDGGPSFTPDSVRATNPDPSTTGSSAPGSSAPGSATPTDTPTGTPASADLPAAARYLRGQLTGDDHVSDGADGTDYQQSVNIAIGLAASGGQDATLAKMFSYLTAHVGDYAYPKDTSAALVPAAVANLALLAEITGNDPTAVGGHNLLTALSDNVCAAVGPDCSTAGNFVGTYSPYVQALAILALARAGHTPPAATISRLEQMQCPGGGFAGSMIAPGGSCDPEVFTTSMAILALKLVPTASQSLAAASNYLDAAQQADGSFLPYTGAPAGDTGSTALATQALLALGHNSAAAKATDWLAARQNTDGGLSSEADRTDSDLYATTSSVPALAGKHLDTLVHSVQSSPSGTPTGTTTPSNPPAGKKPDLTKGSAYLVAPANLIGGHYYEAFPGFADFGLTIDGAFALAATGKNDAALAKLVTFLEQGGKDSGGQSINDWTGIGTVYAGGGSIGKEALLAESTGYDPRNFGGHDLIAALDSTVCAAATSSADTVCAAAGNYANSTSVFSQSLGILAQLRAGDSANAAAPISYLESLQNGNGAWPSLIPNSGDSDVDSTAMAMMALALVPDSSAAVARGAAWLATQQEADGGFPGAAGDSTNSAALAIQGLSLQGQTYTTQIDKALAFLAGQQNSDGGFNVAAVGQRGSDVRASTQVVGGATGISFGTLLRDVRGNGAAAAGAKYLVSQLTGGDHLADSYGPQYGLTADLAIALAATGSQNPALAKVTGYLAAHVADYADPAGKSSFPGPFSGGLAKLALVAEITGQKPTAFGGFNLLKTLTEHVCTAPDTAGSCTAAGDFYQSYSTVSQALAVLVLARAGVTPPASTVSRLEELQCDDGGFPSLLITAGQQCTSDVDTTSYALQALLLVPGAEVAAGRAANYLRTTQQGDGGFTGAAGENSNSTGLALQGLLAAETLPVQSQPVKALSAKGTSAKAPAVKAAAVTAASAKAALLAADPDTAIQAGKNFLYTLQNSNGGFGISAASRDSDVRSTTQVVPALAGAALASLSRPVTLAGGTGGSASPSAGGPSPTASATGTGGAGSVQSGGGLAVTGFQTISLLSLAVLLMLIGGGAIVVARRRPLAGRRH